MRNLIEEKINLKFIESILLPEEKFYPHNFKNMEQFFYGATDEDKFRLLINETRNILEKQDFQKIFFKSLENASEATINIFSLAIETKLTKNKLTLAKFIPLITNQLAIITSNDQDNPILLKITSSNEYNEFSFQIFNGY